MFAPPRRRILLPSQVIKESTLAIQLQPQCVKALLRRAEAYEAKGKYEMAMKDVMVFLASDPKLPEALKIHGRVNAALDSGQDLQNPPSSANADGFSSICLKTAHEFPNKDSVSKKVATLLEGSGQVQQQESDLSYSTLPVAQSMSTDSDTASSISGPESYHPSAVAPGYGFGGSSTSIPTANFPLNLGITIGDEDVFSSQYARYLVLRHQQKSFHGQNQQDLQPSHHFWGLGYPHYHSMSIPESHHPASGLPQYAVTPRYGFGGSSTNIPTANFPLNLPTAPTGITTGYEDDFSSQYARYLLLRHQQKSFQRQNQQGLQPSQHLWGLGYPSLSVPRDAT